MVQGISKGLQDMFVRLDKWVAQKTIVVFTLCEFGVSLWVGGIFMIFREIASLGTVTTVIKIVFRSPWRIYGIGLCFRALCSMIGLVAALKRNIKLTRYYYAALVINLFLSLGVVPSLTSTHCECTDFLQCRAVFSFMGEPTKYEMINPHPAPNLDKYAQREILYANPPRPLAEAENYWHNENLKSMMASALIGDDDEEAAKHVQKTAADDSSKKSAVESIPAAADSGKNVEAGVENAGEHSASALTQASLFTDRSDPDEGTSGPVVETKSSNNTVLTQEVDPSVKWAGAYDDEGVQRKALHHKEMLHELTNSDIEAAYQAYKFIVGGSWEEFVANRSRNIRALKYYRVTPPRIAWKSEGRTCTQIAKLSGCNAKTLQLLLGKMQDKSMLKWTPRSCASKSMKLLVNNLWSCAWEPRCGIISARLTVSEDKFGQTSKGFFEVCQHDEPALPVPEKQMDDELMQSDLQSVIWFQKHHTLAKSDTAIKVQPPRKFNALQTFRDVTDAEGWEILAERYVSTCHCSGTKPNLLRSGCQTWWDEPTKTHKFWCEVATRSLIACSAAGIKVFKHTQDDGKTIYWSEELCRRRACECSGLPLPTGSNKSHVNQALLMASVGNVSNTLQYGTFCQKWDNKDVLPWCYVGYDSVCMDRRKDVVQIVGKESQTNHMHQYYSAWPCVREQQKIITRSTQDICQTFVATTVLVLWLLELASVPMIIIVSRFLRQRCGDYFAVQDQFHMEFSSGSNDDFEVAEGEPQNRRKKASQRGAEGAESASFTFEDDEGAVR